MIAGAMDLIVALDSTFVSMLPVMFLLELWWGLCLLVCWWTWTVLQSSRGLHAYAGEPIAKKLLLCSPLHETWMYAMRMTHHMPPFRR